MYPEFTITPFGRYDRKQQQSLLNIRGDGTLQAGTEIETASYAGSRSNVLTLGANEVVTLSVIDTFDPGINQNALLFPLNTVSNSVTQVSGNSYSWPTGDMDDGTLPTGWSYTEGQGSSQFQSNAAGTINNDTGSEFYFLNDNTSITISVTALPVSGILEPEIQIHSTGEFANVIVRVTFPQITTVGTYTATDTSTSVGAYIPDGQSIFIVLDETNADNQGFTYTVDNIQINNSVVSSSTYSLDVDTTDTIFSGNVTGNFVNNATATQAVTAMALATTTMFPTITSGTVYDGLVPDVGNGFVFGSRDQIGVIGTWDLRSAASVLGASVEFTSWNDWVGNFFGFGGSSLAFTAISNLIILEGNQSNISFTIRNVEDPNISATFSVSAVSLDTNYFYGLTAITAQSGIPSSDTTFWSLSLTGDVGAKSIDLNTNQNINISQVFTIALNSGISVVNSIMASDGIPGDGVASTYTIIDPYGTEVTSFTSSVGSAVDTDVATVIQTIVSAINNNIEMPIDFLASATDDTITITAQDNGFTPGTWTLMVNHQGQENNGGDIVINPIEIVERGTDISLSIAGGGLSSAVTITGLSFTKDQIVRQLTANLVPGATRYIDPDADFALISDDFAEQPALDILFAGDINNQLTFETSTKYWGHT